MITSPILEKSRRINKQLQEAAGQQINFEDLAELLKELVQANTYIADNEGEILGYALLDDLECELLLDSVAKNKHFPKEYNDFLLRDDQTRINFYQKNKICVFIEDRVCPHNNRYISIIPIIRGEKRLGSLLLARFDKPFNVEDLVILEIQSMVVGMAMLRLSAAMKKRELRRKNDVQLALDTLSYSESQAVERIFKELGGDKGLLVASKIADQLGITRSVIVNAIRKLESAGVIESNSLGMKGTHIRVLNPYLLECLAKKA